jgi:hypothetical protein
MEVVAREKLERLATMRPTPPPREERLFSSGRNGYRGFDLEAWLEKHGVSIKREGPWDKDAHRWVLEECPWNGHTDSAAYIVRLANGAIAAVTTIPAKSTTGEIFGNITNRELTNGTGIRKCRTKRPRA